MAEIRVKDGETLDSALRRFKRQCQRSGIQAELRKRECYEKPSVKRKKKSEAARKREYNSGQRKANVRTRSDIVTPQCGLESFYYIIPNNYFRLQVPKIPADGKLRKQLPRRNSKDSGF